MCILAVGIIFHTHTHIHTHTHTHTHTQPITIKNATPSDHNTLTNHPTVTRSRHTPRNTVSTLDSHDNKKRDIIIHDLLQQADIISVIVTWGRSTCLLESTSLEELRDGRMAYIPQPELVTQEDSGGWSGVSMATVSPQGEGKRVDTAEDNVWLTGRSDSVGDLVQSLLKLAPDFGSKNMLCVWFGATEAEIKVGGGGGVCVCVHCMCTLHVQ